jgi:GNAT superfamily N-acetyltransferase
MTVTPAGTEVTYTVTWMEMTARPSYPRPQAPSGPPAALLKADDPPVWFFLALYDAVGRDYAWEDMQDADPGDLAAWLSDPATALWTLMRQGWPHGFFLLDHRRAGLCDLSYFGLVPQAVGRGLGLFLLESAVHTAWDLPGVERLTVNTCSLDHPRAFGLYQRAGFAPVRRSEHTRVLKRPLDAGRIPR